MKETRIWIVRFADGTTGSYYGTYEGAAEIADFRKNLYGGSYTIKGA